MHTTNSIVMDNISFSYDEKTVLRNIHCTIQSGEYIAIIGANGSGKSTLAQLMNGLLLPQEGHIFVDGMDTQLEENIIPIRQKVGMIFQHPGHQIIGTTVEEDMAFGLENLRKKPQDMHHMIDKTLKQVGMLAYKDHPPHALSGGQQQRVSIASILAMEPHYLVLDESTSMLDPMGRIQILEIIKELHEQGITIIHITHFMEEAIVANKIMLLYEGEIVSFESPQQTLALVDNLEKWGVDYPAITKLSRFLYANNKLSFENALTSEEFIHLVQEAKEGTYEH